VAAQNPSKIDENMPSSSDKQENIQVVEETQSTETSNEVVVPQKSSRDTVTNELYNSSIICPSRAFLLFFILSTSFVIVLSLWIKW